MRTLHRNISSIILFVCVILGSLATADNLKPPSGVYTVRDIRGLEVEALVILSEEINERLHAIRNILKGNGDAEKLPSLISSLSNYHVQEVFEALIGFASTEMRRIGQHSQMSQPQALFAAIEALGEMGSSVPVSNEEEFANLFSEAKGRLGKYAIYRDISDQLAAAQAKIKQNSTQLINLEALIHETENSSGHAKLRLQRMEKFLRERLIGQPEVIDSLMDMEWKSQTFGGARKNPDAIYLMGLPGTGKDTAAETFADALHGYEGAGKAHLFRMPVMKHRSDMWQVSGSSTGYIGSENFPPFLEFLVHHSNGKYMLEVVDEKKELIRVVENPDYKGETIAGYSPPNTAVVFVNEFHNWAKQLKDDFLKQAIEKGYFTINNPNGGLTEIYVPVRFVIATNEGIRLTTSREANGQRHGKEMTYEQILRKWEQVHADKKMLKGEILASNGGRNMTSSEGQTGISEELLNRIPDNQILLMRPLSPQNLKDIVNITLTGIANDLRNPSPLMGQIDLSWSPELVDFIQTYDYAPEENARPVKDRIENMIKQPLIDAMKNDTLDFKKEKNSIHLSIAQNADRTRDLVMRVNGETELRQRIRVTSKDVPKAAISDERIDQLANVQEELKSSVFGIDSILERLAQRIVSLENETSSKTTRPASVIMLTGLSSTGKTETAKQLSLKLTGSDDELITFDFSQIQSMHDFKSRILGLKDGLGNPISSDFMKHYDRNNGRLIVAFDELANVKDPDLLKSLYDFFREPVVSTFSDGKARPMGGVMVIVTGNAGQELYANVPRHVPMEVQMAAWQEIYEQTNTDYELQRRILEKYYPEPLITRIGRNNIFFMPPHNYKSLRQLSQFKLAASLKRMESTESRRGWPIRFATDKDYVQFIDTVVNEGFALRYQGASIDSFIRDDFEEPVKFLLLKNKIPSGAEVALSYSHQTPNNVEDKPGEVVFNIKVEATGQTFPLSIKRPYVEKQVAPDKTNHLITAYHEAGHSLVRQALFKDAFVGTKLTIVPGVALIGDQWIYYAGIASSLQEKELATIREWVVRQIAILAAGETAERLVSRGETHSTGKLNDMERATRLATDAIIRYGLSKKWGTHSVPTGMSLEQYVGSRSEKQKQLLESETQKLIEEGRDLAMSTIEANFETAFLPLGVLLAEKGELNQEDLKMFYQNRKLVAPEDLTRIQRYKNRFKTRYRKIQNPRTTPTAVELDASIPKPSVVADPDAMAAERKRKQFDSVPLPMDPPIRKCQDLLTGEKAG